MRFTSPATRGFLSPLLSLSCLFVAKENLWDQGKMADTFLENSGLQRYVGSLFLILECWLAGLTWHVLLVLILEVRKELGIGFTTKAILLLWSQSNLNWLPGSWLWKVIETFCLFVISGNQSMFLYKANLGPKWYLLNTKGMWQHAWIVFSIFNYSTVSCDKMSTVQ